MNPESFHPENTRHMDPRSTRETIPQTPWNLSQSINQFRVSFQALVYRDGNLVSGSLEALVQHMVPTEEYYPDRAYLFAFLLSARLFIKPHELLGEVCALCEHQQNLNGEGGKVSHESRVPQKPAESLPGVHFTATACIIVSSSRRLDPLLHSPPPENHPGTLRSRSAL